MIYQLLKLFVRIHFHFYFKKLYFHGEEKIPEDRAVLFAVNHPTAFLDPIFVAAHIKPSTYFLLRGDVFKGLVVKWFLNQIKTIPVFRFRDGFSSLKNNQETFERCYDLLGQGENILVLAEGQTKHEKKLRPIQKGTARLLLGAYEKHPTGKYCILPIGVNYTAANELRSEMMNAIGTPILLEDYIDAYNENPRKAVKQITDEITRQLNESVVHIHNDEDAAFTNAILTYKRNSRNHKLLPYKSKSLRPISEEARITQIINKSLLTEKVAIRQDVNVYEALLSNYGITDFAVAQPSYFSPINYFYLLLGLPFWLIGYGLFYKIPFDFGERVAAKKVKLPAFWGSIVFGVTLSIYMILTLILLLVALVFWSWKMLLGILIFYSLAYFGVRYHDFYRYHSESKRWGQLQKKQQEELLEARAKVMAHF